MLAGENLLFLCDEFKYFFFLNNHTTFDCFLQVQHFLVELLPSLPKLVHLVLHRLQFVKVLSCEFGQNFIRLCVDFLSKISLRILALVNFNFKQLFQDLNTIKYLRVTFFLCFTLFLSFIGNGTLDDSVIVFKILQSCLQLLRLGIVF